VLPSIPADCSADVTAELQSWVDQLPNHATAELRAGGCYRIEGTLVLANCTNLTLAGNGATLEATTPGTGGRLQRRERSQLNIVNSHDVTVHDLIVRGANPHAGVSPEAYQPAFEAQHAFSLHGDDGVTLDRVQAYDVYGDFVYIGGTAGTPSRHVTVTHSHFERNGRQGISVTDGDDILISRNEIGYVSRSVFDLEPNKRADEARNIRIENNVTGPAHNYWLANKGSGINVGDVTVSHNVMQEPSGALVIVAGPSFGKRGPFTFVDNTFRTTGAVADENAVGAFLFENAAGVRVTGNDVQVPAARHMAGVELRAASEVSVTGNQFTGVTKTVISTAPRPARRPRRRRTSAPAAG
jgi:Right handed beta helix region